MISRRSLFARLLSAIAAVPLVGKLAAKPSYTSYTIKRVTVRSSSGVTVSTYHPDVVLRAGDRISVTMIGDLPQFPMVGVMAENGTVLCYPPSSVKITSAYAAPGPVTASVNDD